MLSDANRSKAHSSRVLLEDVCVQYAQAVLLFGCRYFEGSGRDVPLLFHYKLHDRRVSLQRALSK